VSWFGTTRDSERFSVAPERLCEDRLLEQLCHSKLAFGGAEFLDGLEARVGVQERMLVEQHQSREDFGHDAASRRTHVNWRVVIDELLLRFRQNVIPQWGIVLERAKRSQQRVGGRAVLIRLADFQLRVDLYTRVTGANWPSPLNNLRSVRLVPSGSEVQDTARRRPHARHLY
jgi:hypothetical protein